MPDDPVLQRIRIRGGERKRQFSDDPKSAKTVERLQRKKIEEKNTKNNRAISQMWRP
jgi:hypothetical protein